MKLPAASHTFHTSWEQCPRKAWHSYIARDIERADTPALVWGRRVHEALEQHIGQGIPLPAELQHHAPLYEFPTSEYVTYAELKLGVDENGGACDFFADDVFARGVLDVVLLARRRPDMALLIDHKTGKVRENPGELELHALLLKAHFPHLTTIKGWYNWLVANKMGAVHDLSETQRTWARLKATQARIAQAFKLGVEAFPPRQGPLCGWCPCTQCEFHP